MARKKHLQNIEQEDMDYIDSKLRCDSSAYEKSSPAVNYDFSLSNIKCKNQKQKQLLQALKDEQKQIVIAAGSAGAGKTFISLCYAMSMLRNSCGKYKKLIIMIPTCAAGSPILNIGFLPGTYEDKTEPWRKATKDALCKALQCSGVEYGAERTVESLIKNGIIQYEIMAYIRGRTFDDSIVLIEECSDLSKEEVLLATSRMGSNCKMIMAGDERQKDRKYGKDNISGLEYAIEKLHDLDEVSVVRFEKEDVVRNPLITKILERWDS